MNIEELKLVLDTINSIAGGASDIAVLWIALLYGGNLLVSLVWPVAIAWVVIKVATLIVSTLEWTEAGRQVADAWGASCAQYGGMIGRDREAIRKAIAAAKESK